MTFSPSTIGFEKKVYTARMLSPLQGFKPHSQLLEYRKDPLLGRWCRINVERTRRPKQRERTEMSTEQIGASRGGCVFCPDRLKTSTPLFPHELVSEGRLEVGSATVFPNLYPFALHHAVVVLSDKHFLSMIDLDSDLIAGGLKAAVEYLRIVRIREPEVRYCSINWNHMPSAGASIIHPHLQVIADEAPSRYVARTLVESKVYRLREGRSYWNDLVEVERKLGERFVAEIGAFDWLTSFAPQGSNEVLGIMANASHFFQLTQRQTADLALGLSEILDGYHAMGIESFNVGLFSGPLDTSLPDYAVHVRVISRPSVPNYVADTGFMERLHEEVIVETMPEDTAQNLRNVIKKR